MSHTEIMGYKSRRAKRLRAKKRKQKAKLNLKKDQDRIEQFANDLNKSLPRSEVWFHSLFEKYRHPNDEYNSRLGFRIPDVVNHTAKYVIEIDGSIHNRLDIIEKDIQKNEEYKALGYQVFRVIAYDLNSFENAVNSVLKIRGPKPSEGFLDARELSRKKALTYIKKRQKHQSEQNKYIIYPQGWKNK